MKCEDVCPNLETGGPLARAAARYHTRRCASCAQAAEMLEQLRHEIAQEAEQPLTPAQRQLWMRAAETPSPASPVSSRWHGKWLLAAGACAAAVIVALAVWRPPPEPVQPAISVIIPQEQPVAEIVTLQVDLVEELDRLTAEIDQAQWQVDLLLAQVEIKAVRAQANEMLAQFSQW